MGTKRGFGDVDAQPSQGEPSSFADFDDFDAKRRRQHQYGHGRHKAKEGSMEFSKKRARNIERLLKRKQDLPADVQNDLQRELAALKSSVSDKVFQKKRSAMISKYHMVRFFERKKAARLVKQLRRKLENDPSNDEIDDLRQQLHVAEVDEAYTIYHPHIEPYISLYGGAKGDADEEDDDARPVPAAKAALTAERPPMWAVVERTMGEGPEALNRLKERRTEDNVRVTRSHQNRGTKPKPGTSAEETKPQQSLEQRQPPMASEKDSRATGGKDGQPPLNRRERRRLMREAMSAEESDDDGGGFFEEA